MPRPVVVSTVSMRKGDAPRTVEANVAIAERLLERAAAVQPDIICLPETFPIINVAYRQSAVVAESLSGSTVTRIAAVARRHGAYVVCPLLVNDGGLVFNTAVLLDRRGEIVGTYRKIRPTVSELDRGVTPGEQVEVFDTDFGRVGLAICFDIDFPELWAELKDRGAELVFWPSMYPGGLPLRSHANDHEYYVVSSTQVWQSEVFDITGYPIASTGQHMDVISAQIDLEKRVFGTSDNLARCPAMIAKYRRRVTMEVFHQEGAFTLRSHDPHVTVPDLMREFALEPYRECVQRSRRTQDVARAAQQARRPVLA